jgi:hypothetical protein
VSNIEIETLSLDSPRWPELRHAYGSASDIPALLKQLGPFPPDHPNDEPWFSLWSALAHQGDVYSASFAAIPHIVKTIASDPSRATASFFQIPAWVEICRLRSNTEIPADLSTSYFDALNRLRELAIVALREPRDEGYLRCSIAAIAVSKGAVDLADAILELDSNVLVEFKQWFESR